MTTPTADGTILVSPDNFTRAESDPYFSNIVSDGTLGTFNHHRELAPVDNQLVVRLNRDTLYSVAVFDLDAAPVTITLPGPGRRFMSMQIITEDQYVPAVVYGAGSHTFTREDIGTRYVATAIRTLVDPTIRPTWQPCTRTVRARSRFPAGTPPAKLRFATHCYSWPRPCPTPRACSAARTTPIRSAD